MAKFKYIGWHKTECCINDKTSNVLSEDKYKGNQYYTCLYDVGITDNYDQSLFNGFKNPWGYEEIYDAKSERKATDLINIAKKRGLCSRCGMKWFDENFKSFVKEFNLKLVAKHIL